MTSSSVSLSGVFSDSDFARPASSTPFLTSSSIAAARRASCSTRTAASTKRSVSRRRSSRPFTAVTTSRSRRSFSELGEADASALATLGFLALASRCRALVVLTPACLSEDPSLLDLLVETAKGGLEGLAVADDHFRHAVCWVTPLSVIQDEAGEPQGAADTANHIAFGHLLPVRCAHLDHAGSCRDRARLSRRIGVLSLLGRPAPRGGPPRGGLAKARREQP